MFDNLRRDLARYDPGQNRIVTLIFYHGAWASVGYRFARFARTSRLNPVLRLPLRVLAQLLQLLVRTLTNIELSADSELGPGLCIWHTGYVVVPKGAVLGENVGLTAGVVLGHTLGGSESSAQVPRIGDRVYLGPGAKLIGPIEVGDDALVAAGAVVTRSVPPRAVVAGNPARVIGRSGAFEIVEYPGMEADPARISSLEARDAELLESGEERGEESGEESREESSEQGARDQTMGEKSG